MGKKISICDALSILESNPTKIITVSDWAYEMGYSRSHFSRRFKFEFGLNPKAKGYCIAVKCGFIDEKALHKYLNFHFDLSLSKVKAQVK